VAEALAHVGIATAVEQQTQAGQLHAQCSQRLIDFVRQRGGHLPQRRHARGVHQFVLGGVQLAGAFGHQTLQLVAAALFDAPRLASLGEVEQQEGQGHPHASGGQTIAARAGDRRLRLQQQMQRPVLLRQLQALPEVVLAAVRPFDPAPVAVRVDALELFAVERPQRLLGIAASRHQTAAHRVAERAQVAEAPRWAVAEDDDVQRVGDQQDAWLADPLALHVLKFQLDHQHAEHLAGSVLTALERK